ncbi:hypothetical protein NL676_011538 [Syzygium grande]|nr:hypothetical protein NL676_011538 [Syzygium grande]
MGTRTTRNEPSPPRRAAHVQPPVFCVWAIEGSGAGSIRLEPPPGPARRTFEEPPAGGGTPAGRPLLCPPPPLPHALPDSL